MIQKLIYFAYIQSLEQKKVLFEEKFEKWEGNPMLISLYRKSTKGIYPLSPATVLKDIEEPTELFIINLLEDIYQNYASYEEKDRMIKSFLNELLQPTRVEEKVIDPKTVYSWQIQEKKE